MALRSIQLCIVFTIGFHLAISTQHRTAIPSQPIRLSVELKDPKDVIVGKGQSASLTCAIQATDGNVELVWIYNGNKIALNDTRWELLDNGTLYIPKVTGKRVNNTVEGVYQCLVKTDVGSLLSNAAQLRIATINKEFQEQLTNVTVQEGQPVLLPCKIHSFPSGIVTWIRNNLTLPQTPRYVPLPTGDLLITSTHSSDTGLYSCNVVNPILKNKPRESGTGNLTVITLPLRSSSSHLIINLNPPTFLPLGIPLNMTALVGDNVNLYCAATGWPSPTLQWFNERSSVLLGNSSRLRLFNVTFEATGNYTCVAKNSLGSIKQTFHVDIHQLPYFNHTMQSLRYPPSVTLRLQCNASGVPKPKVYWLKNGKILKYNVRQRKELQQGVIISNSITGDMGFYQCVAENSAGRTWLAAQLVPMYVVPDILPPSNVTCRPFNDTNICLRWNFIENAKAYVIYYYHPVADTELLSVTPSTYQMLDNLNKSTNYTFYLRAFAQKVSDQSEHIVCPTGLTGKRNLQINLYNDSTVQLSWYQISTDLPCDGSSSNYRIQWKRANQTYSNVVYVKQRSYDIYDLDRSIQYHFRVTASTMKSEYSPWMTYSIPGERNNVTLEDEEEELSEQERNHETFNTAPYNLKAEFISSTSINLTWSHNNYYNKIQIVSFLICHIESYSDKNCEILSSKINKIYVKNLKSDTAYEFKVRAKYENSSLSFYSQAIEVITLPEGPPTIQDLRYLVLNSSSICLRWRAPSTVNGTRIIYLISYKNTTDGVVGKKIDVNTSQHCWIPPPFGENVFQAQLTQLNPEVRYTVSITLENTSNTYSISVTTRRPIITNDDHSLSGSNGVENSEDEIYNQQKLGFILGIAISLCGVISCISCLVYTIKRRQATNARPAIRANYYNSSGPNATPTFTNLQLRNQDTCTADIPEMQNLIDENGICHIPTVTSKDLDAKGGVNIPNRQANGNLNHPNKPSYIPNGHVHITENPQFYVHSQNQSGNPENEPILLNHQTIIDDSYEEDSNSNLQNTKMRKFFYQKPSQNDKHKSGISSRSNDSTSSLDSALNVTELTNLDDSGLATVTYRKVSTPLGPNG